MKPIRDVLPERDGGVYLSIPVSAAPTFEGGNRDPKAVVHERRRRVRHNVHSPAYALLPSEAQAASRNAIVDLSEEGMAIQCSTPLERNQRHEFALNFSEAKSHVKLAGIVMWSDRFGRSGLRFVDPASGVVDHIKEWLFLNAITAYAHYAAAVSSVRKQSAVKSAQPAKEAALFEESPPPDYSTTLAALAAVKREVDGRGVDVDAAMRLLAERALSFTRASGAALALAEDEHHDPMYMICRARVGSDAPTLGARLHVGSGFSGQCVRSGLVLRCDDSEIDLRVDRQNCRALGIRSILAAPIRVGDKIEGLLEVFSPQPHAFHASDNSVLHRAAEIAGAFLDRARTAEISPEEQTLEVPQAGEEEDLYMPLAAEPDQRPEALSRSRRILLAAVTLTLLFVAAWLIFGWEGSRLSRLRPQPVTVNAPATATVATVGGFDGLRTLAEHGDAAAQFAVGVHYATGEDVPQDYSEAARWFSLAANQGQVMAQATLAAYYWAGRGIPQDLHKAYFWAVLAQAGGDEASKVRTSFLASRMTHADLVAAQQEADDWIKQHRAQADTSSE